MNPTKQFLRGAEAGKTLAAGHEETAQGFYRDAGDQDNIQAGEFAMEAIDLASMAAASYQNAITEIGRGEHGVRELKTGSKQLRLCETALKHAEKLLKANEDRK